MNLQPDFAALITTYGLIVLGPLAVVEGPVVTVIAAYLASQGLFDLKVVFVIVLLADLIGDSLLYWLGRGLLGKLSPRWRRRLGLSAQRIATLVKTFGESGTKLLLLGKWTHAAGFAVLVAAGAAHMKFWRYFWINFLATIPKSAVLLAVGYTFGGAQAQIAKWISGGSLLLVGFLGALALGWYWFHRLRAA